MSPNMTRRPRIIHTPLFSYTELNQRFAEENLNGHIHALDTASALDSGNDITFTNGISKLIFVLNAGSDFAGTITVTGTTVNRDSGAETGSDTDDIVVDALTTDTSDTDAESNPRWAMSGAYITSKWFKGACTVSTADVTLTDVDSYSVTFEQMNDQGLFTIDTYDMTAEPTNTNAWLYSYLYAVDVTGSKVAITREASIALTAANVTANTHYRLRRGGIGKALNGSTDGLFAQVFYGPTSQTYWQDVCIKAWGKIDIA